MSKALDAATLAVKLDRAFILRGTGMGARPDFTRSHAPRDAVRLMQLAASLDALEVKQCNESQGLTPRESVRLASLRDQIVVILRPYGVRFSWRTDDRGKPLFIHFSDGGYNTLGGPDAGWGI